MRLVMDGFDLFEKDVLVVGHDHFHPPGRMSVITRNHGDQAHHIHTGHIELGTADMHQVIDGRHA